MGTALARRRIRRRPSSHDDDFAPSPRVRRKKRPSRWRRRLAALLVLLLAIVIAAPTVLSRVESVRGWALRQAVPAEAGRVECAAVQLAWLDDQRLSGVKVIDANGNPLLSADSIACNRSLFSLLLDRHNLGALRIERPVVALQTRPGGSNLEDFITALRSDALATPEADDNGATSTATQVAVEVVDGEVRGTDATTGRAWQAKNLNLTVTAAGDAAPWTAAGSVMLAAESPVAMPTMSDSPRGEVRFRVQQAGEDAVQVELLANRAPLAPAEPWLTRWAPGCRLSGETSTDIQLTLRNLAASAPATAMGPATIAPATPEVRAAGKLDLIDFWFSCDALQGDALHTSTAMLQFDAATAQGQLAITKLTGQGDWFELAADGQVDLAALAPGGQWKLPNTDARFTARADLARLAAMLPRTLGLRDGVRIEAGSAAITATSAWVQDGRKWTVAAALRDLAGNDGVRQIRWTQPIRTEVAVVDSPLGPVLEKAIVQSSFAAASLETAPAGFNGRATFDLSRLASDLGQFVDLSTWQLAGVGQGEFILRDLGDGEFETNFSANLTGVQVSRHGRLLYADQQVELRGEATGRAAATQLQQLASAKATLRGPNETVEATLLAPADLTGDTVWNLQVAGNGPVAAWVGRLRPWYDLPGEFAGRATLGGSVRVDPAGMSVSELQANVSGLQGEVAGVVVAEPRVQLSGDLQWDRATGAIAVPKLLAASSTVALQANNLSLRWDEASSTKLAGRATFRADLERLSGLMGLISGPGAVWPRGEAVGQIELSSDATAATANISVTAEPLTILRVSQRPDGGAGSPETLWQEPQLRVAATGAYVRGDDRLELNQLSVEGRTVQMTGSAGVDQLRTAAALRGDVNLTYDAGQLAQLLTSYLGPGVRIEGANQARLKVAGQLRESPSSTASGSPPTQLASTATLPWAKRWQAQLETGWSAASFYGLPLSAARVTTTLNDGQVLVSPIDVAVGQGRLTLSPHLQLEPPPKTLSLAPGPIATQVAVSSEVSDAMLKYFVPVVADAVRTSGTFSMDSQGVTVPVDAPRQTAASGRLVVHQLNIGPGPMTADVVRIVSQLEAIARGQTAPAAGAEKLLTMKEQTIEYRVVDGRVWHRGLEFYLDDVPVRSYGSVGFDETLAITLQIPVQQKWLGREKAFQGLAGQIIEIPLEGTFDRPRVNDKAVANLAAQLLQSTASEAIGNELNRALDKLFKGR
ncbi:MAG: hypothetical protein CMJ58_26375 [Planctomycetaceae bacterium]|nr:hypothetical protein [Planctomycetaceae bacterium]